ncbi:hypothetical protein EY693_03865 [Enterococcus casseliflavus]|uniref:Sip1-related alpha-galactosidase n=1 Tax=Enterococcus TaxID=1350 RepID=UPI000E51A832|nr:MULTISPECIES: Sip1-related alpha-galactosidase [Enterococcus]MBO6357957.1 hypothetical protein [Enterococcus casseliflavus]MBO6375478.1 hypothetical protein [Enterococcus casseliflavus]MDK4439448.1 alpha-galactosidase [Enterococcus faecium]MDT2350657.1 Sip1-related alpha-galactosidase [Enterococcus faecium]RHH53149.1 hypothetical protein DW201_16265 [Enterococcus casseliflavus]
MTNNISVNKVVFCLENGVKKEYENLTEKDLFTKEDQEITFSIIRQERKGVIFGSLEVEIKESDYFQEHFYFQEDPAVSIYLSMDFPENLFSLYQFKEWWSRPAFGTTFDEIPAKTFSLLSKNSQDEYQYLLPLTTSSAIVTAEGEGSFLKLNVTNRVARETRFSCPLFAYTVGKNPYLLPKEALQGAKEHFDLDYVLLEEKTQSKLNKIGWCTWDAFYYEVDQKKILTKLSEFNQLGLPISWLLIDDGWMQVENKKLVDIHVNKNKFPQGLKPFIQEVKDNFTIEKIGIWNTITGYWNGVKKDSPLYNELKESLYENRQHCFLPGAVEEQLQIFFDKWFAYLNEEGINFVKVDSQSSLNNFYRSEVSVPRIVENYLKVIEQSAEKYLSDVTINCMGMTPESIFLRKQASLSRTSDDFVPQEEDSVSEHFLQNAYNNFLHGHLYIPDFDMYWSKHKHALAHMIFRGLSGGPVYLSDQINSTDPEYIWPLIYSDGRLMTWESTLQVHKDSLFENPLEKNVPLIVWNYNKQSEVHGVFSLKENQVEATFKVDSFETLKKETPKIIYNIYTQEVHFLENSQVLKVTATLEEPCVLQIQEKLSGITPIGLIDKLVPSDVIQNIFYGQQSLTATIKEGGKFGFVSDPTVTKVVADGIEVAFEQLKYNQNTWVADIPKKCSKVTIFSSK